MSEKHLYEYAIVRVVPRVEKEEFINVGVILCSKQQQFLKCATRLDKTKLQALDPDADPETIQDHLNAFIRICKGEKAASPIASQNTASRFRWLTAVRSSMIQTSRPHPGLSTNLEETFKALFEAYVGTY